MQKPQAFGIQPSSGDTQTRSVASRPIEVHHQPELDWIYTDGKDDRDGCGGGLGSEGRSIGAGNERVDPYADKLRGHCRQLVRLPTPPSVFDPNALALDVAALS